MDEERWDGDLAEAPAPRRAGIDLERLVGAGADVDRTIDDALHQRTRAELVELPCVGSLGLDEVCDHFVAIRPVDGGRCREPDRWRRWVAGFHTWNPWRAAGQRDGGDTRRVVENDELGGRGAARHPDEMTACRTEAIQHPDRVCGEVAQSVARRDRSSCRTAGVAAVVSDHEAARGLRQLSFHRRAQRYRRSRSTRSRTTARPGARIAKERRQR
ncbi:MAG TPA: hypothetical protein VIJ51_03020 [Solirubrobacteraceae bacterium]